MSELSEAVFSREGGLLRIALPPVLDRRNAPAVLASLQEKLDASVESLCFDAELLRYISPDGLDVILEAKKKRSGISIDHARAGLCDTLASYGFDRFLNVNKEYRFVSVEGCTMIGHGGHGSIYRIGEDTIVKVYRDHSALEVIEHERQYARNAFTSGIPTAIAYDVVETEQGYGVIFELINGMTLGHFLALHPEKTDEYSLKFADLLKTLHSTDAAADLYPDFHDVYLDRAENAKAFLSEEDAETLKRIIGSIPRGHVMIHGDYHPNNVMIDDEGELLLIDMADLSRGNGFFDMGGTYMVMDFLTHIPLLGFKIRAITSLSPKTCRKMWNVLMHRYFGTEDEAFLNKIRRQYKAFSRLRIAASLGMKSSRSPLLTRLMAVYTRLFVLPKADKLIELFTPEKEK